MLGRKFNLNIRSSGNFILPRNSSQVIPPKCKTCGLLHPDCFNEKPRGTRPVSTSFNTIGNKSAGGSFSEEVEVFRDKLERCESEFRVFSCVGCGRLHARPKWCKDRFCLRCAKYLSRRARGAVLAVLKERGLGERRKKHRLKFVTFTCENFPRELVGWGLDRMNDWFTTLRHRVFWSKRVSGGLKRLEDTKGADGNYHLHIHCLVEGSYMPQKELASMWQEIASKDGWPAVVVDIREVKGIGKAIKEISKYCFKPDGLEFEDKAFLSKTFKNRRLYSFFGEWYDLMRGVDLDDLDGGFVCVCGSKELVYLKEQVFSKEMMEGWLPYGEGFYKVEDTS